jgi:hypothetical protein
MNCAEFERILPDLLDGRPEAEGEAHLRSCGNCSSLVADLTAITEQAKLLQACDEPSPRIWNSIEILLRQEGLIHPPRVEPAVEQTPAFARRWSLRWLVPVAAVLLLGVLVYQRDSGSRPSTEQARIQLASLNDEQLLDAVGSRSPAIRAQYAADLQHVNSYIEDAELSARADPNDEEVQQLLMDAYGQKAMLYELALDHSLP